jgi:hypothetical protein
MGKDVDPQEAEDHYEAQADVGSNAERSFEDLRLVAHFDLHHVEELGHEKGAKKGGLGDFEELLRTKVAVRPTSTLAIVVRFSIHLEVILDLPLAVVKVVDGSNFESPVI